MLNSRIDNKNIGLLKNLFWLRQELDVYCLVALNADSINEKGVGKSFFGFLRRSCIDLTVINICKIYEYEKNYELNSIEGVLKYVIREQPSTLDSSSVCDFICKYGNRPTEDEFLSLPSTVAEFRKEYQSELERFKTYRDKGIAHSEFGFNPDDLPSYDVMERLFDFGADFYKLVSAAFVSVVPCELNSNRKVKTGLVKILSEHGLTDIRTEME